MISIQAVKSNNGYYIKLLNTNRSFEQYLFDGIKAKLSFHKDWYIIKEIPEKVSHMEHRPNINHRYVLTDDTLQSDKIPAVLTREQVSDGEDCEGHIIWKPEYSFYKSLYVEISDEQLPEEVEDEFTFDVLLEIKDVSEPTNFKYPTGYVYDRWVDNNKRETSITNSNIIHQELDEIIFPSFIIHETPSKLSSEDTYKIVREHIKSNINLKVARITSDYNFCFTVSKIIPLANPYIKKYTDSTKRKGSKNRVTTRYVDTKEIPIFEMTYAGRNGNYSGYTPIEGFEARNEKELKEIIDTYLEDLMAQINEPVKECSTCNGCGVLFDKVKKHRGE